jgi:hypothetical protein
VRLQASFGDGLSQRCCQAVGAQRLARLDMRALDAEAYAVADEARSAVFDTKQNGTRSFASFRASVDGPVAGSGVVQPS